MKLSTKVAYNTIIQITSKVISTILGLLTIAMVTRYLGQTGFGKYTTIITFLSFFATIADLGLTLVTVQFISTVKNNDEEKNILGNLLGLRLISALLFLGAAPLIILFLPYGHDIKMGVLIAAASFLLAALNQVFIGLFQKYLRMDKVSIAEIASRLFLLLGIALTLKFSYGLYGILIFTVISSFINFLLLYIFSFKYAIIKLKFNFIFWRQVISKSWPLALTIVFNLIYLRADTILLSLIKRPSQLGIIAEVGIYGAAYRVIDVLITIPFMFAGIILPILTMRWSERDEDGFKNILQKAFDVMVLMAIPMAIGTQFLAKRIMTAVAGQAFSFSGPVLQILIFASSIIFLGCMFSHAIIAIDQQKKIIGAYIFTAITSVIGYFIFIPAYSYYGAAWVTIYSEMTIALASFILVWKYTGFTPKMKIFFKSLIASVVMAIGLYIMEYKLGSNLIIMIISSSIIYFISLYFLKGLDKDDMLVLLNK